MIEHLKAIWELAEESCPGGLLLLSVHKYEDEIRYRINNCAYPHSEDKGPDIATPIDIYYCEGVGGRIAAPVCALVRNDGRRICHSETALTQRSWESALK